MLFTFWTGSVLAEPESVQAWRERFPDFALFRDADVLPLLDNGRHRELYNRIRIPACKADIARMIMLREHGGAYVDSHTGPGDGDALAATLEELARYDMILYGKGWEGAFNFMNSVLVARRRAPILDMIIENAFKNLIDHERREASAQGHVPYHVLDLTGTTVMLECIFDKQARNAWKLDWDMKPELKAKINFRYMPTENSCGFHIYQYYGYRKPGEHWSERQRYERLFA
jgi:mannosyltransferase OCH1-like enzyme